jgi:hypothetical protein
MPVAGVPQPDYVKLVDERSQARARAGVWCAQRASASLVGEGSSPNLPALELLQTFVQNQCPGV